MIHSERLGPSCHNWSFRRQITFVPCLWQVERVLPRYRTISADTSQLHGASFLTKEGFQVVGISSIARNWRGMMEGTEELKPEQTGPLHARVRDGFPSVPYQPCRHSKMTEQNDPYLTYLLCIKSNCKLKSAASHSLSSPLLVDIPVLQQQ